MNEPWITFLVAMTYVFALFLVASYGDRIYSSPNGRPRSKPNIYAFSLAVYCTTWTFFGSVGLASASGLNFLAIYVGPILIVTLGFPLVQRIVKLSKEERITSVADFLGARYGKNNSVAAVAAIIAVIGTIPYIALQLKAISSSVDTLLVKFSNGFPLGAHPAGDISLTVAILLAVFAILFGTRHADATEHQNGLMLAIATESVIKLIAFLCVGIFVTWFMFDGMGDLISQAASNPQIQSTVTNGFDPGNFLILTVLSLSVFLLLPRQFHVAVVENNSIAELKRARWLFPLYLVAINLFVIPIALAGILTFGETGNADDYVILLPIREEQRALGLLVFLGGLSAGTAMVVVACVALAIMISNDLVLPTLLRTQAARPVYERANMERSILNIRRTAIFGVLLLAYLYYKAADNSAALASIGLVSFAAIAQLAPAFFGGLFWKNANARGAILGMAVGFATWTYCLLLPTLLPTDTHFVSEGPFGITILRPQDLFELGLTPIANGVVWSLIANSLAFMIASVSRSSDPLEKIQASVFVEYQPAQSRPYGSGNADLSILELKNMLGRYIGERRVERSLNEHWNQLGETPDSLQKVDSALLRFSEQLLASSIGTSSSRLVHTLLLRRHENIENSSLELLDEATRALQFNHDVLQTALDQLDEGITVFDGEYRLASWNRQFRSILNLPPIVGQAGVPLRNIARDIVSANKIDEFDESGTLLAKRLIETNSRWQLRLPSDGQVLEISTSVMPEGGIVITWRNITERVRAAEALSEANETLERRVEERTRELEEAKSFADQANASKTRFLAAAGHDILQPLNAARLFSATLLERTEQTRNAEIANNIAKSLGSVEEILASILAISRLDSAKPEINLSSFPLREVSEQLELEFEPIAQQANLELRFVHSSKWICSDRAQFRRLLQNLISNALKFTPTGKVLVGCRNKNGKILLEVHDTGIGMTKSQQKVVFAEFTRLNDVVDNTPGLGLGLSIVERISKLLSHNVTVFSRPGKGSCFSVELTPVEAISRLPKVQRARKSIRSGKLGGTRVLCVDNEPAILDGMAALLGQWGCDVLATAGHEQAVELFFQDHERPQVVILDYHLNHSTGLELFEEIQARSPIPVNGILITADRSVEVKHMAAERGLAILSKPVRPAALRALVSQYARKAAAAE